MQVKSVILVCSSCGEVIVTKPDEIEFEVEDAKVLLTLECPECGALFEREPLESE